MLPRGMATSISADRRLASLKEDRLGYGSLATHVASLITEVPHGEGVVMAIYGPWGSGKSTFLHFVRLALAAREDSPTVVEFNPWWFSGEEDLARRFFEQLALAFREEETGVASRIRQTVDLGAKLLSEDVADLAVLAATSPIPYGNYIGLAGKAMKRLKREPRDIKEIKSSIAAKLSARKTHVLVLIDDVDRLSQEEIRQLFKVIKSVGDFPNTIYVLALDRQVAAQALSGTQGLDGRSYLEKIVQASFELPVPDRIELRNLLIDGLAEVVDPSRLTEEARRDRWISVFPHIEPFLDTPRNVVSLLNALKISYPLVAREVSLIDLLAVETLHLFLPEAWDRIRRNPAYLTVARTTYV